MTDEEIAKIVQRLMPHIEDSQTVRRRDDSQVKNLLERMLEDQAKEAERRQKRWQSFLRYVLAPMVAFIVGGGGVAGYQIVHQPDSPPVNVMTSQVADQAANKASLPVKIRVVDLENKIFRLGEVSMEQQVQIADGIKYLSDKIDAAHPRQADRVEVPPSIEAAAIKAEAIKQSRGVDNLFETSSNDPLNYR